MGKDAASQQSSGASRLPAGSTIDPSYAIRCMRLWLDGAVGPALEQREGDESLEGDLSPEDAGCQVWDLAANPEYARFLVDSNLLDVVTGVLAGGPTGPTANRHTEIAVGIVGNLCCHAQLAPSLGGADGTLVQVIECLLSATDAACLKEACRVLLAALQAPIGGLWRKSLISEDVVGVLLHFLENSMNAGLLERTLDLLAALVSDSEAAMQWVIRRRAVSATTSLIQDYVTAYLGDPEPPCGIDRLRVTETVADSALRVLEVIAAHEDGHICVEREGNAELLHAVLAVLRQSDREELECSALCLLSEWETDRVLSAVIKDEVALKGILRMLMIAGEVQGPAWVLMSSLCHHIQQQAGKSSQTLWVDGFCIIVAALSDYLDAEPPAGMGPVLAVAVEQLLHVEQPQAAGKETVCHGLQVLKMLSTRLKRGSQ